jgi:hypothetical protein
MPADNANLRSKDIESSARTEWRGHDTEDDGGRMLFASDAQLAPIGFSMGLGEC